MTSLTRYVRGNNMKIFNTDKIVATQLKNGKYRVEAVDVDGTRIVLRKAGNLTKGIVQSQPWSENPVYQFGFNIAEADHESVIRVFTPNNGIDVIAYESK